MSEKITLSMIMPTYNQIQFIESAVASALNQTRDDFELIIVNDGSTDGTREWLEAFSHPKVSIIHQDNAGPAEAINTGIKAATAEYVTWISSDNICLPHFFEACMTPLELDPSFDMSYSTYHQISDASEPLNFRYGNLIALRDMITFRSAGIVGFIYKKNLHDRLGWYEGWSCDTEMWANMLEHDVKFVHVVEPTHSYRFHDDRASNTHKKEIMQKLPGMIKKFYDTYGVTDLALQKLYPSLSYSEVDQGEAWHDYACRLTVCKLYAEAGHVLLTGLMKGGYNSLPKLFRETVIIGSATGNDPLPAINAALAKNPHLNEDQRTAATVMAQVTQIFVIQSGKATVEITPNQLMIKRDPHHIFSLTAWKKAGIGIARLDND